MASARGSSNWNSCGLSMLATFFPGLGESLGTDRRPCEGVVDHEDVQDAGHDGAHPADVVALVVVGLLFVDGHAVEVSRRVLPLHAAAVVTWSSFARLVRGSLPGPEQWPRGFFRIEVHVLCNGRPRDYAGPKLAEELRSREQITRRTDGCLVRGVDSLRKVDVLPVAQRHAVEEQTVDAGEEQ